MATVELEPSNFTGSKLTFKIVQDQIRDRWGEELAEEYNAKNDCFTYKEWVRRGFRVKKGEKSLRSITYVESKDKTTGEDRKYSRPVFLFFKTQVDQI